MELKRLHPETNLILRGGLDDLWINTETQQLIVVDYKATSKKGEVSRCRLAGGLQKTN